ncbi:hypothetical protein NDU88_001692 [Pleurodeles waltl]|uniref:Uncharacterized protein n=1 Tax=Pleurodeles waltl TaxID=8319 RepID=A0AAV7LM92_PLEWA|nr:hypothetical protein NDU88_001692 [Pleurodeles waltl]
MRVCSASQLVISALRRPLYTWCRRAWAKCVADSGSGRTASRLALFFFFLEGAHNPGYLARSGRQRRQSPCSSHRRRGELTFQGVTRRSFLIQSDAHQPSSWSQDAVDAAQRHSAPRGNFYFYFIFLFRVRISVFP